MINAASRGSLGGNIGLPLDPNDINNLVNQVSDSVYPWYIRKLGTYWHVFVGILLIVTFIKIILGCLIRGYVLYIERGFGWWMLAAFWGTIFAVLRSPVTLIQNTVAAVTAPVSGQLIPAPDYVLYHPTIA